MDKKRLKIEIIEVANGFVVRFSEVESTELGGNPLTGLIDMVSNRLMPKRAVVYDMPIEPSMDVTVDPIHDDIFVFSSLPEAVKFLTSKDAGIV